MIETKKDRGEILIMKIRKRKEDRTKKKWKIRLKEKYGKN